VRAEIERTPEVEKAPPVEQVMVPEEPTRVPVRPLTVQVTLGLKVVETVGADAVVPRPKPVTTNEVLVASTTVVVEVTVGRILRISVEAVRKFPEPIVAE